MTTYSIAEYKKMIGANKPKRGSKRPKVKGEKVQSEGEVILANALRALKLSLNRSLSFTPHVNGELIFI
jgi:hypothetical protein